MYAQHQPIIAQWGMSTPERFAAVGLLCLLSARQDFRLVRGIQKRVLAGDEAPLWGWKRDAWHQHREHAVDRRTHIEIAVLDGVDDAELLHIVCSWHGFGMVKGGFMLQMLTGRTGCLDARNAQRYGLGRVRDPDHRRPRALQRHIDAYLDTCRALGGPAHLWDSWCADYAASTTYFRTPWDVSAEHCRILGLDPGEEASACPF